MSYEFTPTGDMAVDFEKIYTDASGAAKPMSEAELATAQAASILVAVGGPSSPPYEPHASNIKMNGEVSTGSLLTVPRADHVHPSDTTREPAFNKNTAFNKNFELSVSNIKMDGEAFVGSLSTVSRSDHVHPSDTTREPAFEKSTAFNKNFETVTDNIKMNGEVSAGVLETVSRADHVHPTDTDLLAMITALQEQIGSVVSAQYPVDSVYITVNDVNPQTWMTGTTWERIAQGRFLAGVGTGTDGDNVSQTLNAGNNGKYYTPDYSYKAHEHQYVLRTTSMTRKDIKVTTSDPNQAVVTTIAESDAVTSTTNGTTYTQNTFAPKSYMGLYVWRRVA